MASLQNEIQQKDVHLQSLQSERNTLLVGTIQMFTNTSFSGENQSIENYETHTTTYTYHYYTAGLFATWRIN